MRSAWYTSSSHAVYVLSSSYPLFKMRLALHTSSPFCWLCTSCAGCVYPELPLLLDYRYGPPLFWKRDDALGTWHSTTDYPPGAPDAPPKPAPGIKTEEPEGVSAGCQRGVSGVCWVVSGVCQQGVSAGCVVGMARRRMRHTIGHMLQCCKLATNGCMVRVCSCAHAC